MAALSSGNCAGARSDVVGRKLGRRPEASTLDRLMAQLPELPDRRSLERCRHQIQI
jgi:hypothetical protein